MLDWRVSGLDKVFLIDLENEIDRSRDAAHLGWKNPGPTNSASTATALPAANSTSSFELAVDSSLNVRREKTNDRQLPVFIGDSRNQALAALDQKLSQAIDHNLGHSEWLSRVNVALDDSLLLFRPLLIHGPSPSGKSRLVAKFANQLARLFPAVENPVCRLACGDFGRQFAVASHTRAVDDFWEQIDAYPILVLENLHELKRYPKAVAELVNLLDRWHDQPRFVLFTSRFAITELNRIDSRLLSRIASGLCVRVHHPGPAARLELGRGLNDIYLTQIDDNRLSDHCQNHCLSFADVKRFVIHHLPSLKSPQPARRLRSAAPTSGSNSVAGLTPSEKNSADNLEHDLALCRKITAAVARKYGTSTKELRGASRKQTIKIARNLSIFLIRHVLEFSYQQIGCFFGNRDHSTIINSYRQIVEYLEQHPDERSFADQCMERFFSYRDPHRTRRGAG